MNLAAVVEYVELCDQLGTALLAEQEGRLYDRLDQLWYQVMTDVDHAEADRRLAASVRTAEKVT